MAAPGTRYPLIYIFSLPDNSKAETDFHDTSFFNSGQLPVPQLPTPAEIRQQYLDRGARVIKFEHLNLIVKIGHPSQVRLEEAQTMRAIRQAFPHHDVPVPEVFGWRTYQDQHFIYMSLLRGPTLRDEWPSLTETDKLSICGELSCIVEALRRITQASPDRFIGTSPSPCSVAVIKTLTSVLRSVNGRTMQDRFFTDDHIGEPFLSIKSFNDFLLAAATRHPPETEISSEYQRLLYRDLLPDTGKNIYFTHGDLTLGNIIVSGIPGSQRIVDIVDWEQAGCYPEYWEYCKLLYEVEYDHEWRSAEWAEKVMESFEDEWNVYMQYSSWRCP